MTILIMIMIMIMIIDASNRIRELKIARADRIAHVSRKSARAAAPGTDYDYYYDYYYY